MPSEEEEEEGAFSITRILVPLFYLGSFEHSVGTGAAFDAPAEFP